MMRTNFQCDVQQECSKEHMFEQANVVGLTDDQVMGKWSLCAGQQATSNKHPTPKKPPKL